MIILSCSLNLPMRIWKQRLSYMTNSTRDNLKSYVIIASKPEKRLSKTLYIAKDIPGGIPRKHDLWFLLEQMKNAVIIPESIYDAAEKLDPYAIVFRYPGENRVDDYRAKQAINMAKTIVEWVRQSIEQ